MKKIALLSLIALLPICTRTMETGTVPLFFKTYGTSGKAKHNEIIILNIPRQSTLADAIDQYKAFYAIHTNNFTVKTTDKEWQPTIWSTSSVGILGDNGISVIVYPNRDKVSVITQDNPIEIHFNK